MQLCEGWPGYQHDSGVLIVVPLLGCVEDVTDAEDIPCEVLLHEVLHHRLGDVIDVKTPSAQIRCEDIDRSAVWPLRIGGFLCLGDVGVRPHEEVEREGPFRESGADVRDDVPHILVSDFKRREQWHRIPHLLDYRISLGEQSGVLYLEGSSEVGWPCDKCGGESPWLSLVRYPYHHRISSVLPLVAWNDDRLECNHMVYELEFKTKIRQKFQSWNIEPR